MKRMCIYLTYDKEKIVDRYIGYMLKELKTCVDFLVVVCNETEVKQGRDILEKYSNQIFYRKNIGFDAGGFKDAICKFVGWKKLLQYDELVLANDSMFGPFRPMTMIFTEMQRKEADFWGLAKHGECINREYGYLQEHIQSYFIVIRSNMLHCPQFRDYWEKLPYFDTFIDTVLQHEVKFTSYFANLGFKYKTLAQTEINDSVNLRNNYLQYARISYELIALRNFPFLKKQQIAYETLGEQTQENLKLAIDYIDKCTEYDIGLIWEHIIRTLNIADMQRSLHLQYIIPLENKHFFEEKIAILVFITYKESQEYIIKYLEKLNFECHLRIFAENENYLELYRNRGFYCEKIQFNRSAELLAKFYNYDLVCVIHDIDMTSDQKPSCTGKSYFYSIWENLIKNSEHICGIVRQFQKEHYLGFLACPQSNFEDYFGEYGKGWDGRYEDILNIMNELNIKCQLSEYCAPFRVTNDFWIRGCVLKKLDQMRERDYILLPYMWTYLVQDAGYYSGIVESMDYASMNEVNLQYYLQQITSDVRLQYGDFKNFYELKEKLLTASIESWLFKLHLTNILNYCRNYSLILVYGAGRIAQLYKRYLPCINAYIVSDGKDKPEEIDGTPVRYLSEIKNLKEYGIILCVNEKNQKEVIQTLNKYGINNYFCI